MAKKPTTNVIMKAITPNELSEAGAVAVTLLCSSTNFAASKLPMEPAVLTRRITRMVKGISGR